MGSEADHTLWAMLVNILLSAEPLGYSKESRLFKVALDYNNCIDIFPAVASSNHSLFIAIQNW